LWDLLIIGAGPAGCAAAIQARRAGLTVLVVEASERRTATPGETLHPGVEPIFERLFVREAILRENFHRHRGIWVEWDLPRRFQAYGEDEAGPWLGFQVDRGRLNDILRAAALDLGVELKRVAAEGLLAHSAGVKGLIADGGELRARWTADATGRQAWLAHQLKLPRRRCSPSMFARFGWANDADAALDGQPCIKADHRGWSWVAPLGGERTAHVALEVCAGDEGSVKQPGTDVTWRICPDCAGPGYFLLGDAAAVLDPLSSHGVLRAMMSGLLCGHLVSANLHQKLSAADAAGHYMSWLTHQFDADVTALTALYRRHPSRTLANLFTSAREH
jgi:flavin-dependent dehydrogenase